MTSGARLHGSLVLAACIGLGAAACTQPDPNSTGSRLLAAERMWHARGLPSYDFTVQRIGAWFISRPVLVTVRDTVITAVVYADSLTAADTSGLRDWLTVDRLFAEVRRQIAAKPGGLQVTYDSLLGYPTRIDVDPWLDAVDDEWGIRAWDLKLWASFSAPPGRP